MIVLNTLRPSITLGPAYTEFGYHEHPAKTSNFWSEENSSD